MHDHLPDTVSGRETTNDLKAALAARRELDPELEDQVLEAFLARVEQRIDARVRQQMGEPRITPVRRQNDRVEVEVVAGTFALAIPLLAIAGRIAGSVGVLLIVAALIAVNLLYFVDRWVRIAHQ